MGTQGWIGIIRSLPEQKPPRLGLTGANDQASPLRSRRQDSAIANQIGSWRRHKGCEFGDEFLRGEYDCKVQQFKTVLWPTIKTFIQVATR